MLDAVGIDGLIDQAQRQGITSFRPASQDDPNPYGLALTLGGGEVSLLELTAAYAAFANGGSFVTPYAIERIEDADGNVLLAPASAPAQPSAGTHTTPVMPAEAGIHARHTRSRLDRRVAYLITDILSDDDAARALLWPQQRAEAEPAGRGQDRHHHRLARQLDGGLHARPGGRRVGGQRRQHADAGRQRRQRRRADLARRDGDGAQGTAGGPVPPAGRAGASRDLHRTRACCRRSGVPGGAASCSSPARSQRSSTPSTSRWLWTAAAAAWPGWRRRRECVEQRVVRVYPPELREWALAQRDRAAVTVSVDRDSASTGQRSRRHAQPASQRAGADQPRPQQRVPVGGGTARHVAAGAAGRAAAGPALPAEVTFLVDGQPAGRPHPPALRDLVDPPAGRAHISAQSVGADGAVAVSDEIWIDVSAATSE